MWAKFLSCFERRAQGNAPAFKPMVPPVPAPPRFDYAAAIRAVSPNSPAEAVEAFPHSHPALTSNRRVAALIGQCAHESSGFTRLEESLYYSAVRLTQVWPKRFPTVAAATPFAKNPEALANKTYGGRMGNNKSGDGWTYRGRGYLQLTGRDNYREFGLEDNPDAAADPATAWRVAVDFLNTHSRDGKTAFEWADMDNTRMVTRIINGGTHGLDERIRLTAKALAALPQKEPKT